VTLTSARESGSGRVGAAGMLTGGGGDRTVLLRAR